MTVFEWAVRHGVSQSAVSELLAIMDPGRPTGAAGPEKSEAAVQAALAVEAAKRGGALWRNNSGAYQDKSGMWVRYGLANTSKKINAVFKSSDQIGIKPVLIMPEMVGSVIGQFMAVENKTPGWTMAPPTNKKRHAHEQAQANFLKTVRLMGGIGTFAQSVKDVYP